MYINNLLKRKKEKKKKVIKKKENNSWTYAEIFRSIGNERLPGSHGLTATATYMYCLI
jgi:hypothetical protein